MNCGEADKPSPGWTSPSEMNVMGLFLLSPTAQIKRNIVMKLTAVERFQF